MAIRITRRQLALAATAAAAGQGQAQRNESYKNGLGGFESKIDPKMFDPVQWTLARHDSAPLKMTFRAKNRKEAEAWQKSLRAKIVELLGGFPAERVPLRAQMLEIREFPAFKREKFVLESRPGLG